MFKFLEPNKIFSITSKAPKYVLFLFIVVLSVGLTEALILSPEDYKQSHAVRIMYVHVPAAWITLGIFSSITFLSILGYIFKIKNFFLIAKSLAPSGFVFNIIALVTGSIWGKPTWGTWWVWDARITSMLILLFLYLGVVALFEAYENKTAAARACAVLSLVGMVNIPIIYKSVDWWYSLHQPASIKFTGESAIDSSMLYPLMLMIIAFYCFFALTLLLNMRAELLWTHRDSGWLKQLVGDA